MDGIRFLAVTLVLADHWSGDRLGFPASYLGVCMFFVLSGFLITRILLSAKEKDIGLKRGHGFSLKQFYIRRTIRIFPLYYLTLAVLFILNVPPVRDKIVWLATYMTNNYFAIHETWFGSVDHLWSLAVEEQFYLFFPFVILFLPLKRISKALLFLVIFAVALRTYFFFDGSSWIKPYVLMPTCLDAFGIGGLLAYWVYFKKEKALQMLSKPLSPILGTLLYFLTVYWLKQIGGGHNYVAIIFLRLAESLLSLSILGFLVASSRNSFKSFFELNPLVYIGKISYGIYIFHNFLYNEYHKISWSPIVKLIDKMSSSQNVLISSLTTRIVVLYLLVIALASISWYVFEKPINKLKNRYGY